MSIDSLIFCIVFEGIVTRTERCKVCFIWVLYVVVRIASFDFFELCEFLVKAILNNLLLFMGKTES
jgi:hypothetical protein